jgi:deoxyribodipyrimidine photo-lyase
VAARARLMAFIADGLHGYAERRRNPSDDGGSSRLSPYLHHGMISPLEVVRAVRAGVGEAQSEAFLNEMLTWRELSLNFCLRNPHHASLAALPDWVQRSMKTHAGDAREVTYSLDALERGATHDPIWNAGQRELVETGQMHNVVRMLWGKAVITWTRRYEEALAWLLHLNDKYALDGRDPNSYAGIQWCFGKFDRPFAARPVWGTIRPMSLERARSKYDMADYLARWSPQSVGV